MVTFDSSSKVVILTGAGVSAESGVRTFRDNDGLWEDHRVEDVATPHAWVNNPYLVWRFYQERRRQLLSVDPNPGHFAIAQFEQYLGEGFTLITQNVDDLHERAGSKNVIHMHGELAKLRCEMCKHVGIYQEMEHYEQEFIPCSECDYETLRPHIVWFGEVPFEMGKIQAVVSNCEVFISIGTSGHVYPAAGLIEIAKSNSAHCIGVNLESPLNARYFDEFFQGKAGEILPPLVQKWIS